MSNTCTPGPWRLVTDFRCANGELSPGVLSQATGSAVAWPAGRSENETLSNGRILAAAPDAIAALAVLVDAYQDLLERTLSAAGQDRPFGEVMDEVRADPAIVAARAALRKAAA